MQELTLSQALRAIEATLEHARAKALAPLAVVVLDAGGHVKAAAREDGSGHSGVEIATAKKARRPENQRRRPPVAKGFMRLQIPGVPFRAPRPRLRGSGCRRAR
jgi:hypothetical protein